jgi:hypothetical protein
MSGRLTLYDADEIDRLELRALLVRLYGEVSEGTRTTQCQNCVKKRRVYAVSERKSRSAQQVHAYIDKSTGTLRIVPDSVLSTLMDCIVETLDDL